MPDHRSPGEGHQVLWYSPQWGKGLVTLPTAPFPAPHKKPHYPLVMLGPLGPSCLALTTSSLSFSYFLPAEPIVLFPEKSRQCGGPSLILVLEEARD